MDQPFHPQKGRYIRDAKPGDRITGFFLVRHKQLEQFRDRSRGYFLTLILADRSGSLLARVWEGASELADSFNQGDIVKAQGDVETYLDRPQMIIAKLRVAKEDEYDLRDFQPSTAKNIDEMLATLKNTVARIRNPHLSSLVHHFFDAPDFVKRFAAAPAAKKMHHAYIGGLLEHTVSVLSLVDSVLALYPEIDSDLLITGALLHDIGKTREYDWETDIDYTDEGQLVGHVVIGDEMVAAALAAVDGFPEALKLRVRHLMLSHHGRLEWGAPRRPQTLEAIALHHIEELNAQVSRFRDLLEHKPEGEAWTPYNRMLGRSLYGGDELDEEDHSKVE